MKACRIWIILFALLGLVGCRLPAFQRGQQMQATATPLLPAGETLPHAGPTASLPPVGGTLPTLPPYSFTTTQIVLEKTVQIQGYTLEYYRNKAYTCARKGYYTFLIVYPSNVSSQTPQALWIDLHGGGLGVYGPDGTYLPTAYCAGPGTPCFLDEETMESLAQRFTQNGLMRKVREEGGFRFLVHSMCDHDLYMGMGDVEEPYNPNIDANGKRPRADGFLALRSALEFTRKKYPTTHIFAYGTSAGSVGVLNLASILALEGKGISGVIADSGATSDLSDPLSQAGCATKYDPQMLEYFRGKMGIVTVLRLSPDRIINAGLMKTPIYAFFNTHDQVYDCPPDDEVTITDAEGRTYTGSGAQLAYRRLIDAINAASPAYQAVSRVHEVCVGKAANDSNLPCSTHIPTFFDAADLGGDKYHNGEDYNEVIMNWVRERLKDPLPALATAR
ncbi:MAG TPA: hypothetical protein VNK49_14610 [Anaerolineales bacterium]|nr:hypothetical protein [Anaerolineales bacterium]